MHISIVVSVGIGLRLNLLSQLYFCCYMFRFLSFALCDLNKREADWNHLQVSVNIFKNLNIKKNTIKDKKKAYIHHYFVLHYV